jgi:hypothetical protein
MYFIFRKIKDRIELRHSTCGSGIRASELPLGEKSSFVPTAE